MGLSITRNLSPRSPGRRGRPAVHTVDQASGPTALVPAQVETDLRQAKWQKIRNPSTISQVVPIGFHPYTLIQTNSEARDSKPSNPIQSR